MGTEKEQTTIVPKIDKTFLEIQCDFSAYKQKHQIDFGNSQ